MVKLNNPIITAGIYVPKNFNGRADEFLMVRHGKSSNHRIGIYGIPGGKQEPGETIIQTGVRELEEEAGLKTSVKDMKPTDFECYAMMNGRNYWMRLLLCTNYYGEIRKGNDETCPVWVTIPELEKLHKQNRLEVNVYDAINHGLKFMRRLRGKNNF